MDAGRKLAPGQHWVESQKFFKKKKVKFTAQVHLHQYDHPEDKAKLCVHILSLPPPPSLWWKGPVCAQLLIKIRLFHRESDHTLSETVHGQTAANSGVRVPAQLLAGPIKEVGLFACLTFSKINKSSEEIFYNVFKKCWAKEQMSTFGWCSGFRRGFDLWTSQAHKPRGLNPKATTQACITAACNLAEVYTLNSKQSKTCHRLCHAISSAALNQKRRSLWQHLIHEQAHSFTPGPPIQARSIAIYRTMMRFLYSSLVLVSLAL